MAFLDPEDLQAAGLHKHDDYEEDFKLDHVNLADYELGHFRPKRKYKYQSYDKGNESPYQAQNDHEETCWVD
eukprot:9550473-Heterocapsa_arctica.AAC.1